MSDASAHRRGASASSSGGDVASKVAAGAASGAFAAFLLNPTELIKTRLMARGPELRNSAWACAAGIARERGIAALALAS